jgi:spermidine synthase
MSGFEEIAWRQTDLGTISLRRRWDPVLGEDVHEVKLGDEYLMSSRFTEAEVELARLGLAAASGAELDVVVGGLGLGYTARAVLDDERVRSLVVVEAIGEVIRWHDEGLLPDVVELAADPRVRFVQGDFFAMTAGEGYDPREPGRPFDAVLVDIDHSPQHVLHPRHAPFYEPAGLRRLEQRLRPGGVFGLWSDDPPNSGFLHSLDEVFDRAEARVVAFRNPYAGDDASNTVYVARR